VYLDKHLKKGKLGLEFSVERTRRTNWEIIGNY
jgi:hypothetical protein